MTSSEKLLDVLTTRQYLTPHERVADVLSRTVNCLGVCPAAVDEAVRWLSIDPAMSIGRLRRTELTQMAQSVHRFWRQRQQAAAESAEPAPRT